MASQPLATRRHLRVWALHVLIFVVSLSGLAASQPSLPHAPATRPPAGTGQKPDSAKEEAKKEEAKKEEAKKEEAKKEDKPPKPDKTFKPGNPKSWTAEQLAEVVILAYGSRPVLQYVLTNNTEEGIIKLATGDDRPPLEGKFLRRFLRKDMSDKDFVRVDVEFPKQTYTFGFNGAVAWAAKDGTPFRPAPEAEASFMASLVHDFQALLRYKEDGTSIERAGTERITGLDTSILELTHKDQTKTRYYISDKTFHILHLEYEVVLTPGAAPTKFRESFYDYHPVQNILVPRRTVLYENGKFVQEIELKETKCRLAKVDEDIFYRY
ncbi:MAG: hypothetical protein K1Y36_13390 [Blastocatellia bacterium]|nr:hypothetical protein [Blastocatellia bacterium]